MCGVWCEGWLDNRENRGVPFLPCNLVEDAEHRYAYGPRNRLTAIDDGNQARYRHNALGQRVYKYGRLSGTGLIGDVNQDGFVDQHDIHLVNGLGGIAFDCDGPGQGDDHKNTDNNGKSAQNTPQGQTVSCVATNIGDSKNQGKGNNQSSQGEIEITQTLLFAYDDQGRLIGEYEEDGTPVQETLWLGDLPVATIREGVAYRVYPDHLGTPRAVADQNDTLLWRWRSDPFGTTEADEDPDQDGQRFVYNLRFPGQYFDGESGKHYNYFRDYDPSTGRYVESDPIGLEGGLNLFLYVGNSPMNAIDMYGLWCELKYKGRNILDYWSSTEKKTELIKRLEIPMPVTDKYQPTDCAYIPLPSLGRRKTIWFDSICFPPPVRNGQWVIEFLKNSWYRVGHYRVNEVYIERCYDDCTGELLSKNPVLLDPEWRDVNESGPVVRYEVKEWVE